ncbi:ROK family protein [Iocasia frigidifontis]|uniref:ROK family protein n=1 Tax=Iocasia fonsfrigidae TaxID=2682810 RepID=A0A8A7KD04_9FIRM|nr:MULTISPECIES: ROK family transcriptional regulator [Halanaerobiaceae]AZO93827.1 ROK family transcriptional regulator [Halocella sp. SP3-1]QTL96767.1 ROK family protein [Iocasia fonsfrigidae]
MEIKVGNSLFIRDLNQLGIFKSIHKYGPISRKELADNTGYSAATVTNHVKTLLKNGYVIETEKGDSTGGRKPVYLTVNPHKAYIFAVSIEVKEVKLIMFNLKFSIETKLTFPIVDKNPTGVVQRLLQEIDMMLMDKGISLENVMGIGISVPGLIDRGKQALDFAPNLGWRKIAIAEMLREKYDLPIVIENEANAAVIGEREFVYPDINNIVYVSINEGIGCGIIFDGKLYRGASGNAGEFGHIIINSSGPYCHCGNKGCWETLASENYIVKTVNKKLDTKMTKEEIYQQGKKGNKQIIDILHETGENIGIGLVNIINSLSPAYLILGGHISSVKDIIYDQMINVLKDETLAISFEKTTIKFTKLKDLAVVYGMAQLVYNKSLNLQE